MKVTKLLFPVFLLAICVSCQKEDTKDPAPTQFVKYYVPDNCEKGQLFVRMADAGTKAGISEIIDANSTIQSIVGAETGIKAERLFPVDARFESRTHESGLDRWYIVRFDEKIDSKQLAEQLSFSKNVQYVEAPQCVSIPSVNTAATAAKPVVAHDKKAYSAFPFNESSEMQQRQWHYHNPGTVAAYNTREGADANVWDAWQRCIDSNLKIGTPNVIVAVIDQGVMYNHEDLAESMWKNPGEIEGNGIDDDNNGYIDDIYGYNYTEGQPLPTFSNNLNHGTHVAGVIAARNNNGKGVNGIAGGCGDGEDGVRIMSLQAIGKSEQGNSSGLGGIVRAFKYAADNGATICQNSWGYNGQVMKMDWDRSNYSALKEVMNYFIRYAGTDADGNQTGPMKGGIILFASGNEGSNELCYPAAASNCISVSSHSYYGDYAYYTNYGPWVDMCAPGGEMIWGDEGGIYSTSVAEDGTSDYCFLQGTSMACPHVSGACALAVSYYWQKYGKGLTPEDLKMALLSSVKNIDPWTTSSYIGKIGLGALDTDNLLNAMDLCKVSKGIDRDIVLKVGEKKDIDLSKMFLSTNAVAYHTDNDSLVEIVIDNSKLTVTALKKGKLVLELSDAIASSYSFNIEIK